ncbi:unnamed protein product [Meganyctiphanes norvegica]|uniref:Sulfotransferase domain-containing protein n=1 Tax=Meganyctiphanes norvegica TaxID=48144 RepID=A0AAV2PTM2_MEGNR
MENQDQTPNLPHNSQEQPDTSSPEQQQVSHLPDTMSQSENIPECVTETIQKDPDPADNDGTLSTCSEVSTETTSDTCSDAPSTIPEDDILHIKSINVITSSEVNTPPSVVNDDKTPDDKSPKDNTSSINIEDENKSYTAIAEEKAKTWMQSFNSLAPRTRQTLRTAAIALVSALALVAIFHLAKLAEHPTQEAGNHEQLVAEAALGAVPHEGQPFAVRKVSKTADGKVLFEGYDPSLAEEMNIETHLDPLKGTALKDLLLKAGPGAVLHPMLGVPVQKSFADMDVKRIHQIVRNKRRPANATELAQTLELVRKRVESDRKKLSTKTLRFWSPGDAPLRVLLVTTWRSGSTFLGQVLAYHPAVFHHYEPLSYLGVKQVRSGREAFQSQQLLHRLLDCKYTGINEYLDYARKYPEDMVGHNMPVWDSCTHGPNKNACFNQTFLHDSCSMFPIQLVKTVRMRLNLTQLFLNDEKMNVKVVYLVRDPRAIMSSRYSSVSWCSDSTDCSSPEVMCGDMQGDLKVATALKHLYPDRFIMMKYEDLATEPQTEIQNLMNFLGMEYSSDIARYVKEHTEKDEDSPWSTKRKSSDRVAMWKKQLPLQEVHAIQNACEPVIKNLGYEILGQ